MRLAFIFFIALVGLSPLSAAIKVTTTINYFVDLVNVIGGDKVIVEGLMGEGVDPHLYKASAGDIKRLGEADLIVYGGLHLEGKMSDIFSNLAKSKQILDLSSALDKSDLIYEEGVPDPHTWFDPALYAKEAKALYLKLASISKQDENYFKSNYERYQQELEKTDKEIKSLFNKLSSKYLITAHDAFSYFARAYGLEVRAIQGISTANETGIKAISELADFIVANKVKAIFSESSVPTKSIDALKEAVKSRGFNVVVGGELYSDSMGDKASNTETYIKTIMYNVKTIYEALK